MQWFLLLFPSIRYWWTKPHWGWISAKAVCGKVPKCELILETLSLNGVVQQWLYLPPRCPQGALMLFYTARIALLRGDFTFVSAVNASTAWTHVVLLQNEQLAVNLFPTGPREVLGVYCSTGGVAPDPSPVLLGADVGLFLWIKMEGSISLRWPALQGEQVVTGAAASTTT